MSALIFMLLVAGGNAVAPRSLDENLSTATTIPTLHNSSAHPAANGKTLAAQTSAAEDPQTATINATLSALLSSLPPLPPKHSGLANSSNPELAKLAEYEQVLGGGLINRLMIFTDIPASTRNAQSDASDMASSLKAFAASGISPLVIMEPTVNGSSVDFHNYSTGAYDSVLSTYFQALKNQGITPATMGMWVYFPEADLPEWGPTDPQDFGPNVTRTVGLQKQYFPGSLSSVMLDTESYPAGSTDWGNGSYTSLAPYLSSIPKGLIDSFGLQGFPWGPPAGGTNTSYDASVFLNHNIAAGAAQILGTSSIWLNTGSFGRMYTNSAAQTITMTPIQRQAILNGVVAQAKALSNGGFKVSVNLFAQDKSSYDEATDWSYWVAGAAAQSSATPVFETFALQLYDSNIDLWLFDSK